MPQVPEDQDREAMNQDRFPEYQTRVVLERADLQTKIVALEVFRKTPAFLALDETHRRLLNRQLNCMREYSEILAQRLNLWGIKP